MTGRPFSPRDCIQCGTPLIPKRSARGMCDHCYAQDRRQNPDWRPLAVPSLRERILSRLIIDLSSGCLVWTGTVDRGGYGKVTASPRILSVHRTVYEMFAEPIPDGLELDHLCHSTDTTCPGGDRCVHRRCASPAHLEVVTALVNTQRAFNRPATRASLAMNAKTRQNPRLSRSGFSSQYTGVTWHRQAGKWQATIRTSGVSRYLGIFASEEDAARTYDAASRDAYGASAYVNFPEVTS